MTLVEGYLGGEPAVAMRRADGTVTGNVQARMALEALPDGMTWVSPLGVEVEAAVNGSDLSFVAACVLTFDPEPQPTITDAELYDDVVAHDSET